MLDIIKEEIIKIVTESQDLELLDLVYKLLFSESL